MFEKNIIIKNKRKPIQIEIPNKIITSYVSNKLGINKKDKIINTNLYNQTNKNKSSEDDYDSFVYNDFISKDKLFFGNRQSMKKKSDSRTTYNIFNYNKKLLNQADYFDKNIKINSKLNLSFENKNKISFLENDNELIIKDKFENNKNIMKIINLFAFVNKKLHNTFNQSKNVFPNTNNLNLNHDNKITILTKKPSKFSRKNKKNDFPTLKNNPRLNITELFIDLEKGIQKNKIKKIEKLNNSLKITNKGNISNLKKINYKMNDTYNINSCYEDILEPKRKLSMKESRMNKSMRKININLNESSIDKILNLNKRKNNNYSINYSNPKRIKSKYIMKKIINDYMNKENEEISNIMRKDSKKKERGSHKIIKKRVVLEEEYIVNSDGDQRLLSVRRLDNENNETNNYKYIKNNFNKENLNVNENSMRKNYKLNNSFISSIFKDSSGRMKYKKRLEGINSLDDSNRISYLYSNSKNTKRNIQHTKNVIKSIPSLIKNKNNKSSSKILKKQENKIPIKTDLKENKIKKRRINTKSNNKNKKIKKKLFFNRLYINKFNKSNNNSKINFYPNYINSNRTNNYLEDKDKLNQEKNISIYNKISFSKKQPFMIYHNEEKNQNFYINNNSQNCANMVNIVFMNNEKNKSIKESEKIKAVCGLKRNKFKEIKSISMDINNNSFIKSTRNNYNKQISKVASCDDNISNKKNSFNIYSSMDNINEKRIKNLDILSYISSKPKIEINNLKKKYIKKIGFNRTGNSQYFIDYIE